VAGPDASLLTQPSRAITRAAAKAGLDVKGLDLFEINEAFAAVGLSSMDDLGIDEDKVNVTAARSPWDTLSACRERASRSVCSWSSSVAAAASRRSRSAAAGARRRGDPSHPLVGNEARDQLVAAQPDRLVAGQREHVGAA